MQVALRGERVLRMGNRKFALVDAGAHRAQDLPQLRLGPDGAEDSLACSDDCDRFVA